MKKTLYHVSHVEGIKVLEPKVSTHGKAWVYATKNLSLALLFGSYKSMGDFDGMYGENKDGRAYFFEAYPGAFKRRFEGCTCYIYEVDSTGFQEGKTSFSAEVVNENPVPVKNCTKIENLYEELMKLAKENKIQLVEYSFDDKYQEIITKHIEDRIISSNLLDRSESNFYQFCMDHHSHIMKRLLEEKKNNCNS